MELSKVEQTIKDCYLDVFRANVKDDQILKYITYTEREVYGSRMIKFTEGGLVCEKPLTTFSVACIFNNRDLICVRESASALVELLNSEFDNAVKEAKSLLIKHIIKTIKTECKLDCIRDDDILGYLKDLDIKYLNMIELHELFDWCFTVNEVFSILHKSYINDTSYIDLIKYAEIYLCKNLKDKIISDWWRN